MKDHGFHAQGAKYTNQVHAILILCESIWQFLFEIMLKLPELGN